MMDVRVNQRELITDSNKTKDSIIRFCKMDQSSCMAPIRMLCPHLSAGLKQDLVIFTQGNAENDRSDRLKAMYPLCETIRK